MDGGQIAVQGQEYVDAKGLAVKLATSTKWVTKHSHRIPGRVKLSGRCVRYRLAEIEKRLLTGRLLISEDA